MMTAEIFDEREDWHGPLGASVAFHALLFGAIFMYAAIRGGTHGENWGGAGAGGGAISATLVSSIPLPAPPTQAQNVLANESKGLSQSLPKQVEETPQAIPIPERETKKKPKERVTASNTRPQPAPEPTNQIPFGQGGPANSLRFSMSSGSGGLSMTGAGGDFGSRYSWYVDKVRRVISENWLKYQVDPNVGGAARVYLTFDIDRSGRPANVQIEQSSHVPSLDYSAVNALKRIDTFGPLPGDYSGSKVSVEFYFDYRR
jgi:periplasmic protein TonB